MGYFVDCDNAKFVGLYLAAFLNIYLRDYSL